jgi:hypothetical protein
MEWTVGCRTDRVNRTTEPSSDLKEVVGWMDQRVSPFESGKRKMPPARAFRSLMRRRVASISS